MRHLFSRTAAAFLPLAALAVLTPAARAQVDANLGTVVSGSPVSISGTTVGRSNDIDTYSPMGNTAAIWDQDFIYQFNVTGPGTLTLDTNDPDSSPDMDFFLLNSLATTVNANGLRQATALASTSGSVVFVDGSWTIPSAGTYYLAIDAWRGNPTVAGTPASGRAGAFSGSLSFLALGVPAPPPPSMGSYLSSTGSISGSLLSGTTAWYSFAYDGVSGFTLDTIGSSFDTELGLYSSTGALVTNNDDIAIGNTDSRITAPAGLAAGTYYLAVNGFDTTYNSTNFSVGAGSATGTFVLHGIATVPEPGTMALFGVAGAVLTGLSLVKRRRTTTDA